MNGTINQIIIIINKDYNTAVLLIIFHISLVGINDKIGVGRL